MKYINVIIFAGGPIARKYTLPIKEANKAIRQASMVAHRALENNHYDHAVYATKFYDEDGAWESLRFYDPAVFLNDDDFYRRTDEFYASHPDCVILAQHTHH